MNLIDEQVLHELFGAGKILGIEGDIITIQFSDHIGQKKFQYPAVFEHFLKMRKPSAQEYVMQELAVLQNAIEAERLRREELRLEEKQQQLAAKLVTKKTTARKPKASATKSKAAPKPTVDEPTGTQNKE
ncbi:hypothetical protein [Clostridium aminobutyricum]|uniref:Uncharacterized protein n=1 Tax=Clostridium aminobutyricum TaxID=33953 RepID=A0A939D734_CLOAM|nr:hypothetical protein [Clostridium aminobutyricum]MBN7772280.1 hypothetical protein [Clostridium aminobutyricum]